MKTRQRTSYKCGQCGYSSLKIVDLHEHLLDHSGSVGYFYDIHLKTAFPKWKYDDSLVYTPTEEGISVENIHKHTPVYPEIKGDDSTIIKKELFDVDIDPQNDFETKSQEDISDIGFEFYKQNPAFNGTDRSEFPCFYENEYSKFIPNLPYSNIKQNKCTTLVHQKKPKKGNRGKQPKRAQRAEMFHTDNDLQSVRRFKSEVAHVEEDQFPIEYLTESDNVNEREQHENGNQLPVVKLENPTNNEHFYKVELTDKNTYLHRCTACSFSCPTKYKLMVHISKYCEKISYICEVCGTVVANKQELSKHKKSCSRKRHKCNICDATFKRRYQREEHLRKHSGECPFICDQCGKAFRIWYHLSMHMKSIHSTARSYKCDQCEKSFKISSGLHKHKKIHNKVLAHICQFCGKKFSTNWNLKAHTRQHSGNKPYSCSKCGESFAHNVSRKAHEANCLFLPGVHS